MKRLAIVAALAVLATLPLWVRGTFYVNIASQILLYAIFALGVNVLAGYAGLVSLGHAGLFGVAAYTGAKILTSGYGHAVVDMAALAATVAAAAVFAMLALRGTGLGFVMITVALGQIVWGVAYRWISLTNGDNGISITGRPRPFGLSLASPQSFYWATFVVFLTAILSMAVFVASPFGASVWSGVAGLLYLYYNEFVSPQAVALTASAEALLMVIAGGTGTLLGPIVGAALVVVIKNVASAYIERWNFVLGAVFVIIVVFMPDGLVPGVARLARRVSVVLRSEPRMATTATRDETSR